MLSWILLVVCTLWLLRQRVGKQKISPDFPLAMPEGTVRALLAIVIVGLPFTFFWRDEPVPSIVSNMVFIVIAFYFQKRLTQRSTVKEAMAEISEDKKKKTRDELPMYWPKFTVRVILIMLIVGLFVNSYFVTSPLPAAINTFIDILAMVGSFIFGMLGREIEIHAAKRKILKRQEKTGETLQQTTQVLEKESRAKAAKIGSIVAYLVCAAVLVAVFMFTFNISLDIPLVAGLSFPVRETMFMSVNVYFGFRQ